MKITEQSIRSACQLLADTLIAKNRDYGNSVEEQYMEHGDTSLIIRLDDKLRRLKQLSRAEANVKTESKADTLLDSAGYSILGHILLSSNEEEINSVGGPLQKRKGLEYPRLLGPIYSDQDDQY